MYIALFAGGTCRLIYWQQLGEDMFKVTLTRSWVQYVTLLAHVAHKQPQDAYAALTKSLMFDFLQKMVPGCEDLFQPVEDVITGIYRSLPQMLGCEFNPEEKIFLHCLSNMRG